MTSFILTALLITVVGLLTFLPLLFKSRDNGAVDRRRLNLALHEERRRELEAEAETPEATAQLTEDLERTLLDDLDTQSDPVAASPSRAAKITLWTTIALIPLLATVGYMTLGHSELLDAPPLKSMHETRKAIQELADRLSANPNDLEGWVLLGRSLQTTDRPEEAAKAYETASRLAPGDPDLLALYAEALAEAQDGKLEGQPGAIIQQIVRDHPKHKMGLWLGGLAAAQVGDMRNARKLWERLRAELPPNGPEIKEINAYIQELGPESTSPTKAAATKNQGVKVKVSLDSKLKGEVRPDDAVFVFARAADGPPMPLAVIRKTVRDLPLSVTLDDSLAMRPGLEISKFPKLILGARISKSGQATPQSGDIEGTLPGMIPEANKVYPILIDHQRP
jgi:cytochrome c-type biogenesis protein CcmH